MIGHSRDLKTDCAVVHRSKYLANTAWLWTVKEQQQPTVFIIPLPIQLYEQSVCFSSGNEVVVDADCLTRDELMSSEIKGWSELNLKLLFHAFL